MKTLIINTLKPKFAKYKRCDVLSSNNWMLKLFKTFMFNDADATVMVIS